MHFTRVHSLLATLVAEPGFFANQPAEQRSFISDACAGGPLGDKNIEAILRFAGLITKVRHNQLYEKLPGTMRALRLAGIEIRFFTHYAPTFAKLWTKRPLSLEARIEGFRVALSSYLRDSEPYQLFVREVMSHEGRVLKLDEPHESGFFQPLRGGLEYDEAVPCCRGRTCVAEMAWSPMILDAFVRGEGSIDEMKFRSARSNWYLYAQLHGEKSVQFFQVTPVAAFLLRYLNSGLCLRDIAHKGSTGMKLDLQCSEVIDFFRSMPETVPIWFCDPASLQDTPCTSS